MNSRGAKLFEFHANVLKMHRGVRPAGRFGRNMRAVRIDLFFAPRQYEQQKRMNRSGPNR